MSQFIPSVKLREIAQQLLSYEAARGTHTGVPKPAVFHVAETFRRSLSRLAGEAGFRALLVRALTVAKAQAPALTALTIQPNGSLASLPEADPAGQLAESDILLIAQLLGLLVTFVGEPVTLRLVREAWPDVSLDTITSEGKEPK